MTEVRSAFIDKVVATPTVERTRVIEQPPLGDLVQDEAKVGNFASLLDSITSGDSNALSVARAKIEKRFRPSVSNTNNLILLSESGEVIRSNGRSVVIESKDLPQIPEEQRVLLLGLGNDVQSASEQRQLSEREIQDLRSLTADINTGNPALLAATRAKVEQTFRPSVSNSNNLILLNETGEIIRDNGRSVVIDRKLLPEITGEEKTLLLELVTQVSSAVSERQLSNQEFQSVQALTDEITSGSPLSLAAAKAKLQGNFRVSTINSNNLILQDANNEILKNEARSSVVINRSQLPQASDEQKNLLIDLCNLLSDSATPTEVKNLVGQYTRTGSGEDLRRLRLILSEGNTDISGRIESVIGRFDDLKRSLELKQRVYSSLIDNNSVDDASAILASYEGQERKDIDLVNELATRVNGVRRARLSADFVTILEGKNYDQALRLLGDLARSRVDADRTCATTLAKALYRAELATYREQAVQMISLDTDPERIYRFIDDLPIRPSVGDIDFAKTLAGLKDRIRGYYVGIGEIARLKKANGIRRAFTSASTEGLLDSIGLLPDTTAEDVAVKRQLLELFRNFVATNRPGDFDARFAQEIEQLNEEKLKQKFERPELGRNKEAFKYLSENFVKVVLPLIEALRDDPRTKPDVDRILAIKTVNGQTVSERFKYLQKLTELQKQRPLTDIEQSYIESVELLTIFNPYLIAALNAEPSVSGEFLRHHFDKLSDEVTGQLKDGDYVPLVLVGTGPNGVASLGEVARVNPELARLALVIDSGEQPGGPFAIPGGPAWRLNSANRRGNEGQVLPDSPNGTELKTVRAYGSPVARWYPGERKAGFDTRQGSINTTVDYLPTPDDISTARYPTNEELQQVLAFQTALLTQNLALRTEVARVEPNGNTHEQGNKIVTLKIRDNFGAERVVKIKTDALFVSSGLGEPTYGFRLEGSRAQRVIDETSDSEGFPKISRTLEAFQAFADRTAENKRSPGKTLAIWGGGNSADTLIEYIGQLFEQGENPLVREITKIYLVSESDLSQRPRYAAINDLRARNGGANLLEFVRARVADVDFAEESGNPEDRKIIVLDREGNPIRDSKGNLVTADSGIAATGFRPQTTRVFESYVPNPVTGLEESLQPLTLPTNPDVAVAEVFKEDPTIVLLGTASKPRFESLEKLLQLPREAREALLRNGAENAVAIGFRAPDTQAATLVWLQSRLANLEAKRREPKRTIQPVGNIEKGFKAELDRTLPEGDLAIPDNLAYDDLILSPLLSYELAKDIQASDRFTGGFDFDLTYDNDRKKFVIEFQGGENNSKISWDLVQEIGRAIGDPDFQMFALDALAKIRRRPKLELGVGFTQGKVSFRDTYVKTA